MRIYFTITPAAPKTLHSLALSSLAECQHAGTVARHVSFDTLSVHRSTSAFELYDFALEVKLEAAHRDRGRRLVNTGASGAGSTFAATFDEWGFFLAALYRTDPDIAVEPNFRRSTATYCNADDFHYQTGRTYDADYPEVVAAVGDSFPYRTAGDRPGRRGYGRLPHSAATKANHQAIYDPRSADFLRNLHTGKVF